MSREVHFKYCPECTGVLGSGQNRADELAQLVCSDCGLIYHRDPKLAACGLVVRDSAILMVKRARPPAKNHWCLPGGFVDRGETVEGAASREVEEETGLKVRAGRLFGLYSYPGYPIVVAIYEVEIMGGILQPNHESLEARWFRPEEIPWASLAFPSTKDSLDAWHKKL